MAKAKGKVKSFDTCTKLADKAIHVLDLFKELVRKKEDDESAYKALVQVLAKHFNGVKWEVAQAKAIFEEIIALLVNFSAKSLKEDDPPSELAQELKRYLFHPENKDGHIDADLLKKAQSQEMTLGEAYTKLGLEIHEPMPSQRYGDALDNKRKPSQGLSREHAHEDAITDANVLVDIHAMELAEASYHAAYGDAAEDDAGRAERQRKAQKCLETATRAKTAYYELIKGGVQFRDGEVTPVEALRIASDAAEVAAAGGAESLAGADAASAGGGSSGGDTPSDS